MATAEELAALTQKRQAAEAQALEDAVADDATGRTDESLSDVLKAALASWVTTFGALTAPAAGAALTAYLAQVRQATSHATTGLALRASQAAHGALAEATALGARHATEFAHTAGAALLRPPRTVPPGDAAQVARGLVESINEQLRLATRMLSPRIIRQTKWRGVVAGLAAARRALSLSRSGIAWCLHRAINDGAAQAIAAMRADRLWVAEPDACVRCLAYAGRLAFADGTFPGGLSMDPQQAQPDAAPIPGPPQHPNCRCRIVPWRDSWAPPGGSTLPALLQERALRSVAAGRARPSESHAARLRAARGLLVRRDVPARARRQAQAAVAAGRFQ